MSAVINRKVLVLNRGWNPVAVISLKKALCLVNGCNSDGTPKAKVLDPTRDFMTFSWKDWGDRISNSPQEGEAVIRSASQPFRVPRIILLSQYDKLPQQRVRFSRKEIWRRDNYQCMYCGKKPGTESLSLDHILPRSQGGLTEWENICLACVECNSRKAGRTPKQAGMKFFLPGYKPLKPKFTLPRNFQSQSWEELMTKIYWNGELENDIV